MDRPLLVAGTRASCGTAVSGAAKPSGASPDVPLSGRRSTHG